MCTVVSRTSAEKTNDRDDKHNRHITFYIGSSWNRSKKTRVIYSNQFKGPTPFSHFIRRLRELQESDSGKCTIRSLRKLIIKYWQTCWFVTYSVVGGHFAKFTLSLPCCRDNACRRHPSVRVSRAGGFG